MNEFQASPTGTSWPLLGNPPPTTLADARLQIHWAAQIVSSVGRTYLEPEADDSHTNLGWLTSEGALASHFTPREPRLQAAIRPADLTLLVLGDDGAQLAEFALEGHRLDDGYAWLADEIARRSAGSMSQPLERPTYDMPEHPVATGEPFALTESEAFAELSRWYAHAYQLLEPLAGEVPQASPVRCWPHHFDIATLMLFDLDKDPESSRQIGVGLSPGDGNYAEPYWYVTPHPPPGDVTLPALNGPGDWRTDSWFGAVLTASEIVTAGSALRQARRSDTFLRSAVRAGMRLLRV